MPTYNQVIEERAGDKCPRRRWQDVGGVTQTNIMKMSRADTKERRGGVIWINGYAYTSEQVDEMIDTLQELRYRKGPNEGYTR